MPRRSSATATSSSPPWAAQSECATSQTSRTPRFWCASRSERSTSSETCAPALRSTIASPRRRPRSRSGSSRLSMHVSTASRRAGSRGSWAASGARASPARGRDGSVVGPNGAQLIARNALPAVVGEGLVGLRHAEDVVSALVRAALLGLRVEQLVRQPLRHRLLAPVARELDQPADRERARPAGGNLDRHLVGGAADAARLDLEHRRQRLDRGLQRLDRVAAGALAEDRQRVVDDPLGGRLLAVEHHTVADLLYELGAVQGIRLDRPDRGGGAAGHYLAFTPYCERAFLRSETPAASSVPRTTL